MGSIFLKTRQKTESVQTGIGVRTQVKVGPSNYYEPYTGCLSNCSDFPPVLIASCKLDCDEEFNYGEGYPSWPLNRCSTTKQ